jgi:hypothetical protein
MDKICSLRAVPLEQIQNKNKNKRLGRLFLFKLISKLAFESFLGLCERLRSVSED